MAGSPWQEFVINGTLPYIPLRLYNLVTIEDVIPTALTTSPFTQVLALGNGLCGSSCDTFSRTAWFYRYGSTSELIVSFHTLFTSSCLPSSLLSKNNKSAASFRFVTIGGSGSPEITPTR